MSITANQATCLAKALRELAGAAGDGNIAFVRCIPQDLIAPLLARSECRVPGWQVFAVAGSSIQNARIITADKAVEIRENKGPATLLIVDVTTAGAGMDGIYNAAKEISEAELFRKAIAYARKDLPKPLAELAKEAVGRARRLGQRHAVPPWREFEFVSLCAETPENIGGALAVLGLWPTEFDAEPDVRDIGKSVFIQPFCVPLQAHWAKLPDGQSFARN